ncbi:hypothetical protein [Streptomyces sp. NPDC048272]|uniref:hypothetical protein n=1 Tax=Streptomyces sp. NPDC048272 TaxID=3154616 RepID=UPI00341BFFB5
MKITVPDATPWYCGAYTFLPLEAVETHRDITGRDRRLWDTARKMCRETEGPADHARWIMAQASRSFACGSDVVVKLPTGTWKVTPGRCAELYGYCYRDHLWTGNLTVEEVTPEQVAAYEPIFRA